MREVVVGDLVGVHLCEWSCVCGGVVEDVCVAMGGSEGVTFEQFALSEFDQVVALALASPRDEQDALDVAQETMARTFECWAEVSGLDRPGAWSRPSSDVALRSRVELGGHAAAAVERYGRVALPVVMYMVDVCRRPELRST